MPEILDPEVDDITSQNEPKDDIDPQKAAPVEPKDDDLRSAMRTLTESVTKLATPKAEPVQKSPEQLAEEWGVYDPAKQDPEFFRKFMRLNPDMDKAEAQAAITEYSSLFGGMQKGIVKQAIMGTLKVIRENDLARLREEFDPIKSEVSSAKAEKTAGRFYSQYPALQDTDQFKFSKAVNDTARDLADKEFADEPAYFKALAEGAAERVRGYNPSFDLGAKIAKPTAGTSPRLPRTSVGGTGGTGNGGAPTKKAGSDDDSGSIDW